MLSTSRRAVADTLALAQPTRLTVDHTVGLIITPAVQLLRRRTPTPTCTPAVSAGTKHAALLEDRVDAAVARLPLRSDGWHVTVLYDEPGVLLVSVQHRLAGRGSDLTVVPLSDLEPYRVVLAARHDGSRPLVAGFVPVARDCL